VGRRRPAKRSAEARRRRHRGAPSASSRRVAGYRRLNRPRFLAAYVRPDYPSGPPLGQRAVLTGSHGRVAVEEATLSDDPNAIRDALRGASDGLLIAIREVDARERMKRGVRPDDPAFAPLAREVRVAAEAVLALAREEEANAQEASAMTAGAGLPTINASTPPTDLESILAEWRAVERRLEAADAASPEAQGLMDEFERLRDRYAEALKLYVRKP
jgi:hypothetical protein